jgi:hypothetical protein
MAVSEEQRAQVLESLERGMSLVKACREAGVSKDSRIYELCEADKDFAGKYARARARGYMARADALMDTAADETIEPASRRIIVDTQKWELARMLPKLFGDKVTLAGDADAPFSVKVESITRTIVDPLAPAN